MISGGIKSIIRSLTMLCATACVLEAAFAEATRLSIEADDEAGLPCDGTADVVSVLQESNLNAIDLAAAGLTSSDVAALRIAIVNQSALGEEMAALSSARNALMSAEAELQTVRSAITDEGLTSERRQEERDCLRRSSDARAAVANAETALVSAFIQMTPIGAQQLLHSIHSRRKVAVPVQYKVLPWSVHEFDQLRVATATASSNPTALTSEQSALLHRCNSHPAVQTASLSIAANLDAIELAIEQ